MLEVAEFDVFDIATSRGICFELALAGVERGLYVLGENGLDHTLGEAQGLGGRAPVTDLLTHMGFTFRYSPPVS
jgi:predicted dehydrogenase